MTILFKNDWKKYPNAIIDYSTTNLSSLELAAKLRVMGVKNNAFFLALHNQKLQGVDPHSKDLTQTQMEAIGIEVRTNAWYFFREVARAPSISGIGNSPIEFNRANIALWWSFFNHVMIILVQPRQTGKSFSTDLLMTLLMGFQCNHTQINLLTKNDTLRSENVARLKAIYDELPGYLKLKTKDDISNTEELSVNKLFNTYKTHVPNASVKRAIGIGRGMTTPIFHIDEGPFQPNIDIAMEAALGAMGAAISEAKRKGEHYGVILTTTAGKKDEREGKYIFDMTEASAQWSELYYDSIDAPDLELVVRKHSRGTAENRKGTFRIYASFSHTQLGKDQAWLEDQLERTGSKGDAANRDFFNRWTSGTQTSPLSQSAINQLNASTTAPCYESSDKEFGYMLRWYIPEDRTVDFMATRKTIIGIDTSDAGGGDDLSVVFTDVETGHTVSVGSFNETNLTEFTRWLAALLVTYQNTTMLIERRSSGATIIDYLLWYLPQIGIDPYRRLFNWVINNPLEYPERYREAMMPMSRRPEDWFVRAKSYFGFATSGGGRSARTELYSTTLQNAAKQSADGAFDKALIGQITSLVTRNNRIDHAVGAHDDLVIGWLLCHWFLRMATNLSHYGIEPRSILTYRPEQTNRTEQELFDDDRQYAVRRRIEALFLLLTDEDDVHVSARYEQELKMLDKQLVLKAGESFSISAFMDQIRDKKKQSRSSPYRRDTSYHQDMSYAKRLDARQLQPNTYVL